MLSAAVACLALTCVSAEPEIPETEPVAFSISPAKAPIPALRYQFLPEVRDLTTGNAATIYYRAFDSNASDSKAKERDEQVGKWLEMPFDEFKKVPRKDIDAVFDSVVLKDLDKAARKSYCDWDLTERIREDGIDLIVPGFGVKKVADLLALRARADIAAGRFDQAARSLETGFQYARHLAEGPTLMHGIFGIAAACRML